MEEIFKDIPSYEGLYQVSNLGNVKSLNFRKEIILKPYVNIYGYYTVRLKKCSKGKTFTIHQLVAITFLNHKPNGHKIIVDHISNIKTDNSLENLQLITNRENTSKDKKNGSSKYIGVYFHKGNKKWVATIRVNGELKRLGAFTSEEEASEYYQNALIAIENNEEMIVKIPIQTSNYKGVSWKKLNSKWAAQIMKNGKKIHLGLFTSELEASEAYQNKLKEITL